VIIWVVSRVRLPAVAPLVATGAYLPVWLWDQRKATRWLRRIAPGAVAVAALLIFCAWAIDHALVKHPLTQIPADAHPGDIVFDNDLKLAGWRWFASWPSAQNGWAFTQQAYAVELFWQVLQPTNKDYSAYIAYIQDDKRYVADDAVIGTITRPPLPTSQWKPGEIYSEIMGFKFPDGTPFERTGAIHLGVYLTNTNNFADPNRKLIGVPITSDPSAKTDLILQSMAVYDPNAQPTAPSDQTSASLVFGDQIALKGYSLPTANPPGSAAIFKFDWQAIRDVGTDYVLFVHVFDTNNQLQAQYNAPVGGALLSSNWRPGVPIEEQISIQLPTTPGTYQVYMGLYDPVTKDRLTVDAPDYRPHLGEISIGS
ncbi:MAG TPA: hypothetical protein VHD90_12915, partial [Phototrophicaceae bacterium]|nr:hypothetical protein [Phototrophicaceae bacterium]